MLNSIMNHLRVPEKKLNNKIYNSDFIGNLYLKDRQRFSSAGDLHFYNIAFPSDTLRMWMSFYYEKGVLPLWR